VNLTYETLADEAARARKRDGFDTCDTWTRGGRTLKIVTPFEVRVQVPSYT